MKRTPLEEHQHSGIIRFLSERLVASGYSVLADHINWSYGKPILVDGFCPDIFAFNAVEKLLFEIETKSTVHTRYALKKLKIFSAHSEFKTCLVLPSSFGLNEHIIKSIDILKRSKINVRLAKCDLKREEITFVI